MSIGPRIRRAKFGGAKFYVTHSSVKSGRKTVVHDFVGSDKRNVEDLGKLPPVYEFSAFIKGSRREYEKARKKLIGELTKGKPSNLSHPFLGVIKDCVALPYTLTESMTQVGIGEFTLRFTPTTAAPSPVKSTLLFGLDQSMLDVMDGIGDALDSVFDAIDIVADNIDALTSIFTDIADLITDSVSRVSGAVSSVSRLSTAILVLRNPSAYLMGAAQAIQTPFQDLVTALSPGKAVSNANKEAAVAASTPEGQTAASKSMYEAHMKTDSTVAYTLSAGDTQARKDRRKATETLITMQRAMALAGVFASAAKTQYKTLEDAQADRDWLEEKWAEIAPQLPTTVLDAMQSLRAGYLRTFQQISIALPRQVSVPAGGASTAVIAYRYYGNLDKEQTILDLNSPSNPGRLGANVTILGA